ncbi:ATP-dependent helicase [Humidisolicoccus flavus]|uniref:ATP-dependent helicase n=1 Tax=Humidisolicoccus flavus TaxID=3111414 RepID=UPI00324A98A9
MKPEDLLAGLDDQQQTAATALRGPVAILAGAGTGKTRTITHRIAYGVAVGVFEANKVLALTFTSKAAGELRSRLSVLGAPEAAARTFHSAALAQLSYFWPRLAGNRMPEIMSQKSRLIADVGQKLRLPLDVPTIRDIASEIEWRKANSLTFDEYSLRARTRALPPRLTHEQMMDIQQQYESIKDERRMIDFEDILLACTGMLLNEPIAADAVRSRYRYFMVDEFQDVSPLQHALLDAWLGGRADLCVVGDASQTIYSFTGATSRYLLDFAESRAGAKVIRLEQNYRSSAPIVGIANRLMRGRPGALELQAAHEAEGPEPTIAAFPSDRDEVTAVAAAAKTLVAQGISPKSIAVLTRIHSQTPALVDAFAKAGLSTQVAGAVRFFEIPEVQRAIMMLRSAPATKAPLFQSVIDIVQELGYTHEAPEQVGAVRARWDALNVLVRLADEAPEGTTVANFAAELLRRKELEDDPSPETVTIATLHAAKGLEWDHVFIIGMVEGLLPISYASGLTGIDEERRLAYVGVTRARKSLQLSYYSNSAGRPQEPSRFLSEMRSRTPGGEPQRAR